MVDYSSGHGQMASIEAVFSCTSHMYNIAMINYNRLSACPGKID